MIAIVFSLEFESAAFRAKSAPRLSVCIWTLGITGSLMGKALRREIEKARPEILVTAGFSGGLQPELHLGDIVVGENYSAPELLARLPESHGFLRGKLFTAPTILETSAAKQQAGRDTA